jgi:hypothetical protein
VWGLGRNRRWAGLVGALVVALLACGGESGEPGRPEDGSAPGDEEDWGVSEPLPDDVCALVDRWDAVQRLFGSPELFATDAATLAGLLADRREAVTSLVEVTTGEVRRIVTGAAALPKWSPDGEWLVFGYAPLGESAWLGTWMARADGTQLREAVPPPTWFPAWLPPA